MTKPITGILLDIKKNEVKTVTFEPSLENYYDMLDCKLIDIQSRTIGTIQRKVFDIIIDYEGLFKEDAKISAVDDLFNPMFVGNILIVGLAVDGKETSLTDDDVEFIKSKIKTIHTKNHQEGYLMLTQCNYAYGSFNVRK